MATSVNVVLVEVDGYEIEIDTEEHTAKVSHGRFSAGLRHLEVTGELRSSSGKVHKVPPWLVGDIANAAYRNGL